MPVRPVTRGDVQKMVAIREEARLANENRLANMSEEDKIKAQKNREEFPELAAFVDQLREYFPDATVVKIERNH